MKRAEKLRRALKNQCELYLISIWGNGIMSPCPKRQFYKLLKLFRARSLVSSITVAASKNCPRLIELPRQNRKQPQLFVFGELAVKTIQFPDWTEEEYYLYGFRLRSRPYSWGVIEENDKKIELFHISGSEEAPLEDTKGFVGYWANDLLDKQWANKVFECYVWKEDGENRYPLRIKRSEIGCRQIKSEIKPATG